MSLNTASEQRNTCSKNSKSEINNKTEHDRLVRNNHELSTPKTTRFLDDEYPSLTTGASKNPKNVSKNYQSGKLCNFVGNAKKCANSGELSYNSDGHTISENESASEWETEDEESFYSQKSYESQQIRCLVEQNDGNKFNSTTPPACENEYYVQPKSILRQKYNDSETKQAKSGKSIVI